MWAARSQNSGGKRFDLLLMNFSYSTGRSVSTKPGVIHPPPTPKTNEQQKQKQAGDMRELWIDTLLGHEASHKSQEARPTSQFIATENLKQAVEALNYSMLYLRPNLSDQYTDERNPMTSLKIGNLAVTCMVHTKNIIHLIFYSEKKFFSKKSHLLDKSVSFCILLSFY